MLIQVIQGAQIANPFFPQFLWAPSFLYSVRLRYQFPFLLVLRKQIFESILHTYYEFEVLLTLNRNLLIQLKSLGKMFLVRWLEENYADITQSLTSK